MTKTNNFRISDGIGYADFIVKDYRERNEQKSQVEEEFIKLCLAFVDVELDVHRDKKLFLNQ